MGMGFDLGTSRFRCVRRNDRRLLARQAATGYVAIAATPARTRLLSQAHIAAIRTDDSLLLTAGDAEPLAAALSQPLIPLLPEGRLPEADPVGRQVAAELIAGLCGRMEPAATKSASVVLPRDAGPGSPIHDFLLQLLKLQGFEPQVIAATQAIGLSELGESAFAGIVLSFGAAGASLALVERGQLEALTDVPCGGDWVDRRLAEELQQFTYDPEGRRYLDTAGMNRWKHAAERKLGAATCEGESILEQAYVEILTSLLARFRTSVVREGLNGARRQPLPIVCHGGCTRLAGFLPLWERLWRQAAIELTVGPSRLTRDDNWAVARGCLIHAEIAAQSVQLNRAA